MSAPIATAARTYKASLSHPADFDSFRSALRRLLAAKVDPRVVAWSVGEGAPDLFSASEDRLCVKNLPEPSLAVAPRAPKSFAALAPVVLCHRAKGRFVLLHRLLERLQSERALMEIASDEDVARAQLMAKNVRRCSHKMKAFVRFRATHDPDGEERFVAWFEPEHHTVDLTAGFFVRRFPGMRWSILTPLRSAHWDGEHLRLGAGASKEIAPDGDVNEGLWQTYYASIFNPARLKVRTMQSEMPKRYWKNMPEGELVAPLIRAASSRTGAMFEAPTRAPARFTRIAREREAAQMALPDPAEGIDSLDTLARLSAQCTRCPLHECATQTVAGEGRAGAAIMFVGEQPGDREDILGRPFVGPAGELFRRALGDAQIQEHSTFVTNAVKHFKFEPRGKRRIHKSPTLGEIERCRFWLDHERRLVAPRLTVALGASAARALSGKSVSISHSRGRSLTWPDGSAGLITAHPASILRVNDAERASQHFADFVADLAKARALVEASDASFRRSRPRSGKAPVH